MSKARRSGVMDSAIEVTGTSDEATGYILKPRGESEVIEEPIERRTD